MRSAVSDEQSLTTAKERVMYTTEHELVRSRLAELQTEAEAAARARRLYLARRASRRAERAVRRAARASAAVW
ncbi:hypothetical protein [Blastococcus sp. TF02-8]|uniref:hypothetical protein n=1 Tax=Blastococcus sp. TF02-8 TaxID=2250574 RepID=UPI0011BFB1B4|nr:hypothetical protein [Blastococcus sp. TF02-8]